MGGYEKPNLKIRLSKKEANKTPISKGRILALATHHQCQYRLSIIITITNTL